MKRVTLFLFSFIVIANMMAQGNAKGKVIYSESESGNRMVNAMSDNMQFAVGFDSYQTAFIWDLVSGEVMMLPREADKTEAYGVSDGGLVVGSYEYRDEVREYSFPATCLNGEWTQLPLPEEGKGGATYAVTSDGKKIGGFVTTKDAYAVPAIWENGTCILLDYPKSIMMDTVGVLGAKVVAMSADGSVITGVTLDDQSLLVGLIWKAPDYKCEVFGLDTLPVSKEGGIFESFAISPSGEWITGRVSKTKNIGKRPVYWTFRYNVLNEEFEVVEDMSNYAGGFCIDDAGTAYCVTAGLTPMERTAYIQKRGQPTQLLNDYLISNSGIDLSRFELSCSPIDVSADGNVLVGSGLSNGGVQSFVVYMDDGTGIAMTKSASHHIFYQEGNELVLPAQASEVNLYSVSGQWVKYGQNAERVDVSNLSDGLYLVRALIDGKQIMEKIHIAK